MKKSGFIIAVLLTLCSMSAMAQMPSGVDTLKLDKVNWRITYTGKVINDTTQETPIYRQAEMRLDIGDKVTYFYNQSYMLWEKQVLEMIKSGGVIDLAKAVPIKAMKWDFLKNYPEEGKTYYSESWKMHTYHCIEPAETPDWEIVPDSTATIIGYTCHWQRQISRDAPGGHGTVRIFQSRRDHGSSAVCPDSFCAPMTGRSNTSSTA